MRRTLAACMCLCALLLAGTAAAQQKRRVAVLSFDDVAVKSSSTAALGSSQDVGASLADVLVNELLKSGAYSIVERRSIDAVLTEQNLSNSSRADSKTAAAIGRVLGVDAIIAGSVLQFGVEEKEVAIGSSTLDRFTRGVVGGGKRVDATARVAMTARLIDVTSGEVLTSATGNGESSKSSVGATGYATGVVDM